MYNKIAINTYLSIIIINVNTLNASSQKTQERKMGEKTEPISRLSTRNPLPVEIHTRMEKIFHANGKKNKKARVAIHISEKKNRL